MTGFTYIYVFCSLNIITLQEAFFHQLILITYIAENMHVHTYNKFYVYDCAKNTILWTKEGKKIL